MARPSARLFDALMTFAVLAVNAALFNRGAASFLLLLQAMAGVVVMVWFVQPRERLKEAFSPRLSAMARVASLATFGFMAVLLICLGAGPMTTAKMLAVLTAGGILISLHLVCYIVAVRITQRGS